MTTRSLALLLFVSVLVAGPGCSSRSWYEGFREMERQNCYELESPSERQACLERVDETSYGQYEKEREASKRRSTDSREYEQGE